MKILVIDIAESIRHFFESELITFGHEIRTTSSVNFASQIWNDFQPDLVLCGATPNAGEDVLEFLQKVRQMHGSKTPIIIMSMCPPHKNTNIYLESGASRFISKNDGFKQIFDAISQIAHEKGEGNNYNKGII